MNLIVLATVIYVLVAVAMVVLILMQRGAGAQAGSGFGAGASATVFGASGSANFLSTTTKWLAVVFFAMSLGMAWYASNHGGRLMPGDTGDTDDVGLMSDAAVETPAVETPVTPVTPTDAGPAPATDDVPAPAEIVAPAVEAPAEGQGAVTPAEPAENPPQGDSGG